MRTVSGIWIFGEEIGKDEPEEETAIINGKTVHCPICREPLKAWVEGCSLLHFICKNCNFRFIVNSSEDKLHRELEIVYEG